MQVGHPLHGLVACRISGLHQSVPPQVQVLRKAEQVEAGEWGEEVGGREEVKGSG